MFVRYNSLIVSYIHYGNNFNQVMDYYCEEFTFINLNFYRKKSLRFMTNSGYIAHTTSLLIKQGLLNVRDMYKLKLLKFHYKLSYDLLPPYFNYYIEVIDQKPVRNLR